MPAAGAIDRVLPPAVEKVAETVRVSVPEGVTYYVY
jgi:hypothetical protein